LYNSKNKLVAEGDFIGKKKEGVWKYFSSQNYLLMIENYRDGKLNGEKITYYKDGKVTEKTTYKNGKINGLSVRYNDKGNVISTQKYKNGKLDGEVEYCDALGNVIIKGAYKNGTRVGKWKHFSEGKVVKVEDYDKSSRPNQKK